jgi:hypothetical protein
VAGDGASAFAGHWLLDSRCRPVVGAFVDGLGRVGRRGRVLSRAGRQLVADFYADAGADIFRITYGR